jgi:hypothetical protein
MDDGLKDFIQELRDYGNARRGDLAGMILEAANRLEFMSMQLHLAGQGSQGSQGSQCSESEG